MAYEIIFHYHPRNEDDGKYNTEETLTFTKTVGRRKSEEVPLEKVAAVVMGEMARRDVWIVNVELFEFAKREIAFKETKGGCIIKNRKFQFSDLQSECTSQEVETHYDQPQQQYQPMQPRQDLLGGLKFSERLATPTTSSVPPPNQGPLRHEVFRPSRQDLFMLQQQGLKLTNNKPYPIFRETVKQTNRGELIHYVVADDNGQKMEINSMYFEPMRKGLDGMGLDILPPTPEGKLSYVDTAPHAGGSDADIAAMIAAQDAALARRG